MGQYPHHVHRIRHVRHIQVQVAVEGVGKFKIGASSLGFLNYSPEETLELLAGLGFDVWEIVFEGRHTDPDIGDILPSYDIEITAHAPFSDLNIASLNERIRKESVSQICDAIRTTDRLCGHIVTIHSGRLSPLGLSFEEQAKETNIKSIKEILGFSKDFDIRVCVENTPNFFGMLLNMPGDVQELQDAFGRELGFTFDIAHANTWKSIEGFLDMVIDNLHIHDNDGTDDIHMGIGNGNIDFRKVFSRLKDYNGPAIIEVKDEKGIIRSKKRLERFLI